MITDHQIQPDLYPAVFLDYEGQKVRFIFSDLNLAYYLHALRKYYGPEHVHEYYTFVEIERSDEEEALAKSICRQIDWIESQITGGTEG